MGGLASFIGAHGPAHHRRTAKLPAFFTGVVALCLTVIGPRPAHAGGFSVNPIRLELTPSKIATSLTVVNYNSYPLYMQVRVYRWEHKGGEEVLTDVGDDAPLITPPLFHLDPNGSSQVIRIGFQKAVAPLTEEHQWRVIVEEVPKTVTPSAADVGSAGPDASPLSVSVHMRVSLPLFQRPPDVRQALQWSLARSGPGSVRLTAENAGSVTERLDELHLGSKDDTGAGVAGPVYVFPGERRTFDLHPTLVLPSGNVRLTVQGTPHPLISELAFSAQ